MNESNVPSSGNKNYALVLTDRGNAARLAHHFAHEVRYVDGSHWMAYDANTGCWVDDPKAARVMRLAKQLPELVLREFGSFDEPDHAHKWFQFTKYSASRRGITNAVKIAEAEGRLWADTRQFDKDPHLLNVANGVLNLESGTLQSHSSEHMFTKVAPVRYEAGAQCPRFDAFMATTFCGDKALIREVLKAMASSITGIPNQELFIAYGKGANGKTVLMRVMQDLLGRGYAVQMNTNVLLAGQKEHDSSRIRLRGARLAVFSETPSGLAFDEANVKLLTGGDMIAGRRLYHDETEFAPTHTAWMVTNYLPRVQGLDHGIWRRLFIIPFDVTVPKDKQDPNLVAKLVEEGPGILNRLVEAYGWYVEDRGMQPTPKMKTVKQNFRDEMDPAGCFIRGHVVQAPGRRTGFKDLYDAFEASADERGFNEVPFKAFNKVMRAHGHASKRTRHGWVWLNVTLGEPQAQRDRPYPRAA